jgi:methylated-DNA-[protein]-cysteine S-methyltransferase
MAMKTADTAATGSASADPVRQSTSVPSKRHATVHLSELVAEDDDGCDVCIEALPGYVLGDLDAVDTHWIEEHTSTCSSCQDELVCYKGVDMLVERCCSLDTLPLPPLPLVRTPRALQPVSCQRVQSPLGDLLVAVSNAGVCEIGFGWMENEDDFSGRLAERGLSPSWSSDSTVEIAKELSQYFDGARREFAVPLDYSGLTPFTRSVLEATAAVPFGETRTYRDIAIAIGKPNATRAVGNALHRNPIPLVVPCHRIVKTGSGLGGYAGGVDAKRVLLSLEGVIPRQSPLFAALGS